MPPPSPFSARAIRGDDRGYVAYHAPRFAHLLAQLDGSGLDGSSRLLDVGRSRLTALLHQRFGVPVDSLGFGADHDTPEGRHWGFDLERTQRQEDWRRDLPRYDLVVLAEVLEHLHTAPQQVLGFLRTLMPDGGRLVLQTPNAASLAKRLKLLAGRHPYDMIRTDPRNPGHFREYTRGELAALAAATGFTVEDCRTHSDFDARFPHDESGAPTGPRPLVGTLKNLVYRTLPAPLRPGITTIWRAS